VLGCTDNNFRTTINFHNGTVEQGRRFNLQPGHRGGRDFRRGFRGGDVPFVYSYPYPYPYPVYPDAQPTDEQPDYSDQQQDEPPARTIYERRSNVQPAPNPTPSGDSYADRYAGSSERAPEPQAQNTSPVPEPIPIVIVYKDGREKQIENYAIVGDTLYDVGNLVSHKIKLADLDLNLTIQKNEERGVEFNVPPSLKPKT
jgi:hypothetical protein